MATMSRSLVATGYINIALTGTTAITGLEESAEVNLKFTPIGTPSGGETFIINVLQNTYVPNPPPATPMQIAVSYVSGKWVCNYPTGDGGFTTFYTAIIPIPPDCSFSILDLSSGKMKVDVLGKMYKNYSN